MSDSKAYALPLVKCEVDTLQPFLSENKAMLYSKKNVGVRLAEAMKRNKVSNTELAELTGVSLQAVTGWIKTGRVADEHLTQICDRCECSIDWLLTGRESKYAITSSATTQAILQAEGYEINRLLCIETKVRFELGQGNIDKKLLADITKQLYRLEDEKITPDVIRAFFKANHRDDKKAETRF